MRPKTKVFALKFDTFWKFPACRVYGKSYGRMFMIYASENEAVCCEVQTHVVSFPPVSFAEKSSGCNFTICVTQTNILDFNIL